MKPVYFFHIPKTSGRFFVMNTTTLIEHELLNKGIQYKDILKAYGHRSFKPIDTVDALAYTFLREPVARTISHWLHIHQKFLTGSMVQDKKALIDYLYANPTSSIIDYQTKFIAYSGDDEIVNITPNGEGFIDKITPVELSFAKERLSKLTYIFDQKDQGDDLRYKFLNLMYTHFGITPTVENTINLKFRIGNNDSLRLYSSFSDSEIQEVADLMPNDMEIYHTTTFTKL